SAYEAASHEASAYEATSHEAASHEAASHEAASQEASAYEAACHPAPLNVMPPEPSLTRYLSSAAFGFGGLTLMPAALAAVISPAPAESSAPTATWRAVTISAPLTWS